MDEPGIRQVWSDEQLDRALDALHADVRTGERAARRARAQLMLAVGADQEGNATMSGHASVAAPERAEGTEPPRRKRSSAVRWLSAAAAVGALVVGAVLAQTVLSGGGPPVTSVTPAAAVEVLSRSAERAAAASDPTVGPGQYRYVETHSWYSTSAIFPDGESLTYLREEVNQRWVPADQDEEWQETRTSTGNRKWIDGSDEEAAAAGFELDQPSTETYRARGGAFFGPIDPAGSWQQPTPSFLENLPRDPQQLYQRLAQDAPDNSRGDAELLVYAADVLRSGLVPADLRAAIYQALTRLPGLTITDGAANLDGRTGTALGVTDPIGNRQEIIIDPETGAFIGERDVDPDGVVMGFTAVTDGVADEIGVKPTG